MASSGAWSSHTGCSGEAPDVGGLWLVLLPPTGAQSQRLTRVGSTDPCSLSSGAQTAPRRIRPLLDQRLLQLPCPRLSCPAPAPKGPVRAAWHRCPCLGLPPSGPGQRSGQSRSCGVGRTLVTRQREAGPKGTSTRDLRNPAWRKGGSLPPDLLALLAAG